MEEKEAIFLLQKLGYTIIPPDVSTSKISPSSIIDYFYNELRKSSGDIHTPDLYTPNKDKDMKEITRYQDKALRLGIKKSQSLQHLLKTVKLFFRYINDLGLKRAVTLGFLLSNKGSWILVKLNELHKQKILEYEDGEEGQRYRDTIETTECNRFNELVNNRLKEVEKVKELLDGKEKTNFSGTGLPKSI